MQTPTRTLEPNAGENIVLTSNLRPATGTVSQSPRFKQTLRRMVPKQHVLLGHRSWGLAAEFVHDANRWNKWHVLRNSSKSKDRTNHIDAAPKWTTCMWTWHAAQTWSANCFTDILNLKVYSLLVARAVSYGSWPLAGSSPSPFNALTIDFKAMAGESRPLQSLPYVKSSISRPLDSRVCSRDWHKTSLPITSNIEWSHVSEPEGTPSMLAAERCNSPSLFCNFRRFGNCSDSVSDISKPLTTSRSRKWPNLFAMDQATSQVDFSSAFRAADSSGPTASDAPTLRKWLGSAATSHVRRSKHGFDSVVISFGGIARQGPLSLHTVGAHFC